MTSEAERSKILEMIEAGTISAAEGLRLITALEEAPYAERLSEERVFSNPGELPPPDFPDEVQDMAWGSAAETWVDDHPQPPPPEEIQRWKRWWFIPFWIGVSITVVGGTLMYWAYSVSGIGFWFGCAWLPFLLGVTAMAMAWGSRNVPWLHVRVQQKPGETPQRIAISFPLPIRLAGWGLRTFGHHIPHMEGTSLDEVVMALSETAKDGTPFFVNVDEGENGEKVQVFIG